MKNIADLNSLYSDAEAIDADIFAEQKSNVRLVLGEHYSNKNSRFWNRIRDSKQISNEQKLRITKNHIQKICKTYVNNIVSMAPGVTAMPKNETEIQDIKAAELNEAVWKDLKQRNKFGTKIRQYAKDFIDIGECIVKVFWDPNAGELKGFEAEIQRDDNGQPVTDEAGNVTPIMGEDGQMVKSNKAVFTGGIVFERFFAFDVLRAPSAKDWEGSAYVILRKMVAIKDLQAQVGNDEEKLKMIAESGKTTYQVFDGTTGSYKQTQGQCMVREFYFRKCADYPSGYYYITTESGILFEAELPFGIWPVKYVGFDEVATSPRARSIIKVCRPYQAEINRAGSKIAEHQITLGDDKLLIQSGTKLTHGGTLAGIRGIQYAGAAPGILQGRSGEQYLPYMQSQIMEMYDAANVAEDKELNTQNTEPYSLLYRSVKSKKKFIIYGAKFEEFLVDICETSLDLAKHYYPDELLIPAIGKREYVNIKEFKNSTKLCYQIRVEPQTEDIESRMGKQLAMMQVLQYCSKDLGKDSIGRIIKSMPFVNQEEAFGDLTMDYDNSVNDILALDRGEQPQLNKYDDHKYIVKRLVHRMRQSDFRFLDPNIQNNYEQYKTQHEQLDSIAQRQILAAQNDFIPTGGYLVGCDFYVNDPSDPGKTRRARLPYESIVWLIQRLKDQGSSLESLQGMPQQPLADMSQMISKQQPKSAQSQSPQQGSVSDASFIPAQLGTVY